MIVVLSLWRGALLICMYKLNFISNNYFIADGQENQEAGEYLAEKAQSWRSQGRSWSTCTYVETKASLLRKAEGRQDRPALNVGLLEQLNMYFEELALFMISQNICCCDLCDKNDKCWVQNYVFPCTFCYHFIDKTQWGQGRISEGFHVVKSWNKFSSDIVFSCIE